MAFGKKKVIVSQSGGSIRGKNNDYTPILHVADSIKEYQGELVTKEVATINELKNISESFDDVLGRDIELKTQMDKFSNSLEELISSSDQIDVVKTDIAESVSIAQEKLDELNDNTSFNDNIIPFIMPKDHSIDIDELEDLALAEYYLKQRS